jgi:acyl carrier protein phosphodiesterase
MNYLAHLFLAPRHELSITGSLLGDFRKYLTVPCLPDRIAEGVNNHLYVDSYTDASQIVKDLKLIFSVRRRRFAGIIIDVAFDHFLSSHWSRYSSEDRAEFIAYCYACLQDCRHYMPERMQYVIEHMIAEDWLGSYVELPAIGNALDRISDRMRFENCIAGSIIEIEQNYQELEQGFLDFFPGLFLHMKYTGKNPAVN